jgi:hypothetical protein
MLKFAVSACRIFQPNSALLLTPIQPRSAWNENSPKLACSIL